MDLIIQPFDRDYGNLNTMGETCKKLLYIDHYKIDQKRSMYDSSFLTEDEMRIVYLIYSRSHKLTQFGQTMFQFGIVSRRPIRGIRFLRQLTHEADLNHDKVAIGIHSHPIFTDGRKLLDGLAYGNACTVSTYANEFLGPNADTQITESVHEIGHSLGLRHCSNPSCLMYDGRHGIKSTMRFISDSPLVFCKRHQKKVDRLG